MVARAGETASGVVRLSAPDAIVRGVNRYFDCEPRERVRRVGVFAFILGVIYIPAVVTLAMLLSGNA